MVEAEAGSTASLAQPTRTRRGQTRLVAPMDQAAADAVGHSIPDSTQGSASQGSASQGSATQQGSAAATVGNPLPNTALIQSSPSASVKPKGGFPKTGIAVLLLAALGGLLYFLFPGLSWRFTSGPDSPEAPMGEVSGNASRPATPSTPGLVIQPAELTVGSYARIRQSDIPGISAAGEGAGSSGLGSEPSGSEPLESGTTGQSGNFSQLKLYPKPEVASEATPNIITGTIPTGGIVKVVGKQVTTDGSEWVELQICSIPSGVTLDDVPAESDGTTGADSSRTADSSAEPLNVPETTQTDRPLILPPGSTGWIVAEKVAKVSENIQDLEPTQAGMCGA